MLLIVLYVDCTYPPFTPSYIFILHIENLFFLTYPLQIPYIRNCFYNDRIEVASVPDSAKKHRCLSFPCFLRFKY
ncbi:hypothetical protein FJR70_03575 [Bacillus tropicus]|nr:hypothetical protein FJR70_03575 [Bacillus tropicus]